jgi:polyamine oxidase
VELTGGGVTVTSASGETEAGSHVVVTVPLGVLKNGLPAFVPPLPPERAEALRGLGFGRYEKVALKFDEPFWREAGWSHLVLFPSETGEPALWVFDLDAFSGVPILVCHTFHSATSHLANGSTAAAALWVTGMIAEALGSPCPDPVAIAVTGWAADPYAASAYTHAPPGSANADLDLLGTTGGRPPALRGRAHAERATRLRRRCHDERNPRGQAAARHTLGGFGPIRLISSRCHGATRPRTTLTWFNQPATISENRD